MNKPQQSGSIQTYWISPSILRQDAFGFEEVISFVDLWTVLKPERKLGATQFLSGYGWASDNPDFLCGLPCWVRICRN
jgi:hypothetical protein